MRTSCISILLFFILIQTFSRQGVGLGFLFGVPAGPETTLSTTPTSDDEEDETTMTPRPSNTDVPERTTVSTSPPASKSTTTPPESRCQKIQKALTGNTNEYKGNVKLSGTFKNAMKKVNSKEFKDVAKKAEAALDKTKVQGGNAVSKVTGISGGSLIVNFRMLITWTAGSQNKSSVEKAISEALTADNGTGGFMIIGNVSLTSSRKLYFPLLPTSSPSTGRARLVVTFSAFVEGTFNNDYLNKTSSAYKLKIEALQRKISYGFSSIEGYRPVALSITSLRGGSLGIDFTVTFNNVGTFTSCDIQAVGETALNNGFFEVINVTVTGFKEEKTKKDSIPTAAIIAIVIIILLVLIAIVVLAVVAWRKHRRSHTSYNVYGLRYQLTSEPYKEGVDNEGAADNTSSSRDSDYTY